MSTSQRRISAKVWAHRRLIIIIALTMVAATSCSLLDKSDSSNPADPAPGDGNEQVEVPAIEPVEGTADGSPSDSFEPVGSDFWVRSGEDVFSAPNPSSDIADLAHFDGATYLAGGIFNYEEGGYAATIWSFDDIDTASATATTLPTSAPVFSYANQIATIEQEADAGVMLVAAGFVGRGTDSRAAVWVDKGDGWAQVDSDAFRSLNQETANLLLTGPEGSLLVVGSSQSEGELATTAVWSSPDGLDWERLDTTSFEPSSDSTITVTAGAVDADRSLLVGHERQERSVGVVWLSSDGVNFEKLVPEQFAAQESAISSVTLGADGSYVAVGSVTEGGVDSPASWTSVDGRIWQGPFVSFAEDDFDDRYTVGGSNAAEVVSTKDGFVARSSSANTMTVWSSTDGQLWEIVETLWGQWPQGAVIEKVIQVDDQLVALSDNSRLLLHDSSFGWRRRSLNSAAPVQRQSAWINDLAAYGEGFMAVGGTTNSVTDDGSAAAWRYRSGQWEPIEIDESRRSFDPIEAVQAMDPYPVAFFGSSVTAVASAPDTWDTATSSEEGGSSILLAYHDEKFGQYAEVSGGRANLDLLAVGGNNVHMAGMANGPSAYSFFGFETDPLPDSNPASDSDALQWVTSICADGSESVVAITATEQDGHRTLAPYLRTGRDPWEPSEAPSSFSSANQTWAGGCTHTPEGYYVIGGDTTGDGSYDSKVWFSADGNSWEDVALPEEMTVEGESEWLRDITFHGSQLIVVGNVDNAGYNIATIWVYEDGSWTSSPISDDATYFDAEEVAVASDGTVLVAGERDGYPHLYTAPITKFTTTGTTGTDTP